MNATVGPLALFRRPRGLWLCRELPFPLDTGDRIYSGRLIRSLADAGCDLTVAGFPAQPATALPSDWPVTWRTVADTRRGRLASLLSPLPLVAASHATAAYRRLVAELAEEVWDFVVFDQYGLGWAMAPFLQRRGSAPRPVLVHVAHDHEASVYASLVRGFRGPWPKRLALWQNGLKTGRLERRIARSVDLVTAITEEDAARFAADAPHTTSLVLKPGHDGPIALRLSIDPGVPRNVVMVGNYNWIAKAENLRQFVAAADPVFAARGIALHVIGSMPPALADELRRSARATVLHGFVPDIAPHFAAARIAVVPEEIGGGFKLKFLDYLFGRVAVATLGHAAAGLPQSIRDAMICRDDLPSLVQGIADAIDDTAALDARQQSAWLAAQALFRWEDRGTAMLSAVTTLAARGQRGAAAAAPRSVKGMAL